MKARRPSHHTTVSDALGTAGMEILDHEREKKWIDQMDAILIFVCLACF